MEAAARGAAAIAVSLDNRAGDHELAARFTAGLVKRLQAKPLTPGTVLSVNIPAAALRRASEVAVARMGGSEFLLLGFKEVATEDESHGLWRTQWEKERAPAPGTDAEAYLAGHITITPLRVDWTDEKLLEDLKTWSWETP
jgi:5'-nucleotidase